MSKDFYIKDEGYADVRLHNAPAKVKQWCHDNGYKNSLVSFGETWGGEPVWYPGMESGRYKFAISPNQVPAFIKKATKAGFTVESEF